ncbi:hypothetical protein L6452_15858 [Arctium lappa]|uniref:Uncharacterized protein n=1 Tax=Arctium lappa TaxID=4217 RepID=A0ACB9CPS1_ARCLA|nr:hypothetical protein L6452_15858 [Arctium lappa]
MANINSQNHQLSYEMYITFPYNLGTFHLQKAQLDKPVMHPHPHLNPALLLYFVHKSSRVLKTHKKCATYYTVLPNGLEEIGWLVRAIESGLQNAWHAQVKPTHLTI